MEAEQLAKVLTKDVIAIIMGEMMTGLCQNCDITFGSKRRPSCGFTQKKNGQKWHECGDGWKRCALYPDVRTMKALRVVSRHFRRIITIQYLTTLLSKSYLRGVNLRSDSSPLRPYILIRKFNLTFGPTKQQSRLIRINTSLASMYLLAEVALDHWNKLIRAYQIEVFRSWIVFRRDERDGVPYERSLPIKWMYEMLPYVCRCPLIVYAPGFKPPGWYENIQSVQKALSDRWDKYECWNMDGDNGDQWPNIWFKLQMANGLKQLRAPHSERPFGFPIMGAAFAHISVTGDKK